MATITYLSNDVIDLILQNNSINIKDVVSFAITCKRFYNTVADNNVLWQKKLYQRWPSSKDVYYKQRFERHIDYKQEIKLGLKCRKELLHYLSQMSEKHFYKKDLSDANMEDFDLLFRPNKGAYSMNYYFLMDELTSLLAQSPIQTDCDLTQRYYVQKVLPYLKHCNLKDMWQEFINCPEEQQILEQAAIIVEEWYYSERINSSSRVKALLDIIKEKVLDCLKKEYPKHSIFSTSPEQFCFWKHNNIDDNKWKGEEGLKIVNTISKVLFDELCFCAIPTSLPYKKGDHSPEHTFISYVLENKVGTFISLAIIYHSVARRLGIRCDLVDIPSHFFLSWKPEYCTTNNTDEEYCYIDLFHRGSILSKNDCPKIRGSGKCPISNNRKVHKTNPIEVMLRMIKYLEIANCNSDKYVYNNKTTVKRSLLELRHLIEPDNMDTIMQLLYYYAQHNVDFLGLRVILNGIRDDHRRPAEANRARLMLDAFRSHEEPAIPHDLITPQKRLKEMKLAIGMIVKNIDSSNDWLGVIIGWSIVKIICKKNSPHPYTKKIFYAILGEDGKLYRTTENTLTTCIPRWINNVEIGRYFCRFQETHYVPNEMLARKYPWDVEFVAALPWNHAI